MNEVIERLMPVPRAAVERMAATLGPYSSMARALDESDETTVFYLDTETGHLVTATSGGQSQPAPRPRTSSAET